MTNYGKSLVDRQIRLAILMLAAGEGSRMGGYPKALLVKDGQTLLRRFIRSIQNLFPIEVLVVTGFYSDQIAEEIKSLNNEFQSSISFVKNPSPEVGQASSVRMGLESLHSDYDVLLVALSDQPNVGAPEIYALLTEFHKRATDEEILLPVVQGQRGNPVLFSRRVIEEILQTPGMVCRNYMDLHPNLVKVFNTDNQAYVLDADTQLDIQTLGLGKG